MTARDPFTVSTDRFPAFLYWLDNGRPKWFFFDAVESERHEKSSELTSHAVEKGVDVTDHVLPQPIRVQLEVFITDTPIGYTDIFGESWGVVGPLKLDVPENNQPFGISTGAVFQAVGSAVRSLFNKKPENVATVFKPRNTRNFIREAQNVLWKLIDDATPVIITTPSQRYEEMYLVSAPLSRTTDRGGSATFSLEFQKLRVVTAATTKAPKEIIATPKIVAPPKAAAEKRGVQSVLVDATDALGITAFLTGK